MSKWQWRGLVFALTLLFGVGFPYLLMSGCDNGFAVLAPTDDFVCHHKSEFLRGLAGDLWGWFVFSSFAAGLPIVIFWVIVFICVRLVFKVIGIRPNRTD